MGIYGDLQKLNETKYVAQPQQPEQPIMGVGDTESSTPTPHSPATTLPHPPGITVSRHQPTKRGGMVSRYHDAMIQAIRVAVKLFGKEAATHRFTPEEKKAIAEIVFTYKQRDIRTSENEITRIGVNFIIRDYQENGEGSLLHRVLMALNS